MFTVLPFSPSDDHAALSRRAAERYAVLASIKEQRAQPRLDNRRQRTLRARFRRLAPGIPGWSPRW